MKTTILNVQHWNIYSLDELGSSVEQRILALSELRQIDEARIRFERFENVSPAYQVRAHLVTPGPDLFAEGRDHTLRAAFAKVLTELEEKISNRATKRMQRIRSNLSLPATKRTRRLKANNNHKPSL